MDDQVDRDQVERFKQIAGMMECDEDEARWNDRLRKVARQKAAGEKPE